MSASRGRLIGLLLTVVFLGLALYRVDMAELAEELRRVNYIWILPSAACTLAGYALRTLRWRTILSRAARAPFGTLFSVLVMGFATNNLLPGRLGEIWRAYMLGRKRGVRKASALASVFVERVFDGLALIALLAMVSMVVTLPGWGREVQILSALVFLGATTTLALVLWRPRLAGRLIEGASRPLPTRPRAWLLSFYEAFVEGLAPLRRPSVLVRAALLSAAVWTLEGGSYYLLSRGIDLGLSAAAELPAIGLTLVMINLGIMVPSAPGYVGTQEFFGTSALGVFGVNHESALVLVLVSHAVQYALVTGLGLLFFAREHLSPRALTLPRASARTESEAAA